MTLAKLSLLIFLYRIFKFHKKFSARPGHWVPSSYSGVSSSWYLCSLVDQQQRHGTWPNDSTPRLSSTPNHTFVTKYYDFCNIITDFAQENENHMRLRNRTSVSTLSPYKFIINGQLTPPSIAAIGIRRQYILYTASQATDPSWQVVVTRVWMTIEVDLAISCACLPTLQPLFSRICPSLANIIPSAIRSKFSGNSAIERAP